MLTLVLELEGYRVVAAVNGLEALTLAQQHQPVLIVLDLMMPVMGGEEFRTRQLTTPAIEDIPVVIVSARYDAHKLATRLNAAAWLGKPIDVDALTMGSSQRNTGRSGGCASAIAARVTRPLTNTRAGMPPGGSRASSTTG